MTGRAGLFFFSFSLTPLFRPFPASTTFTRLRRSKANCDDSRSARLEQKEGSVDRHLAGERPPLPGANRQYHRRGFTVRRYSRTRITPPFFSPRRKKSLNRCVSRDMVHRRYFAIPARSRSSREGESACFYNADDMTTDIPVSIRVYGLRYRREHERHDFCAE